LISKSFLVVALLLSLVLFQTYAGESARATSNLGGANVDPAQYVGYIAEIVIFIVIFVIIIYAVSRRRKSLPKHPSHPPYSPPSPPPQNIDLTPKQPPVQQIVIKEVVKVKCLYCGALIDSTAQVCPICGAPRT